MKNLVTLYIAICILALTIKLILKAVQTIPGKKPKPSTHEQEHDRAHLIKFIILFIIAFVLIFVMGGNSFFNT